MLLERTARGITARPYVEGTRFYGFVDNSGGRNDSAVLSIAHFEREKAVLDYVREIESPHAPASAIREFCTILKAYHVTEVFGDRFAASFASQHYESNGINYRPCELSRSEIYLAVLPHLLSNNIVLLDLPAMQEQFTNLERKPGRTTDIVDHGSGKADDIANSVAGVLELVLRDNVVSQLGLLEFEKQIASGLRRDPTIERPRKAVTARQEPAQRRPGPCEACGSTSCSWVPGGRAGKPFAVLCNQCQAIDGKIPLPATTCLPGCGGYLPQHISGMTRCGNCGAQSWPGGGTPVATGCTFKELHGQRGAFHGIFDRLRSR
jgi:hypothetical protein